MPYPINQQSAAGPTAVTAAVGLVATFPLSSTTGRMYPTHCLITSITNGFRWRADGSAVAATTGQIIGAAGTGGTLSLMDPNFDYSSIIRQMSICSIDASVTATINVAYFAL